MSTETIEQESTRRRVDEFVSGMKDRAATLKNQSFEEIWTGTREFVKENPGKVILLSLGLGVVIGSLLRRK